MSFQKLLSRFKPSPGPARPDPAPDSTAIEYAGNYTSWAEVLARSTGYDSDVILRRTRDAQMKVKTGEAVFQRDSVIFDKPELPWPVLACLLRIAAANDNKLSVMDFGGALGSSYFTCRSFLSGLKSLRWSVIEQSSHVDCGRKEFQDDQLRFYYDIAECLQNESPNVLLISSVLQYLEDPWKFIASLSHEHIGFILVDQTPFFMDETPDRLTLQTVPEWIYPASYPCWMLNHGRLLRCLAPHYNLISEFPAHVGVTMPFENGTTASYAGFFLAAKPAGNENEKL